MIIDIVDFTWRKTIKTCPHCDKKFYCYEKEQIPGFRDFEEMICPNCLKVIKRSMEYEYYTEVIYD